MRIFRQIGIFTIAVSIILTMAACGTGRGAWATRSSSQVAYTSLANESPTNESAGSTENAGSTGDAADFSAPIPTDEIADTHYLELINADYPILREQDAAQIVSAWPTVAVSVTEITLHETMLEAVSGLFAEAREAGVGKYFVSSGYRDYDKQKEIYDEAADKSFAQMPNHSEHQTGLAADIMANGVKQNDLAGSREGRWLAENSWKHGMILRYADDKRDITGIAGESWHFRYVGQPHAWYCAQNDMCYEEYIQELRDTGGYAAELDGLLYAVSYQMLKDGVVYVPEGVEYDVSTDNTGGYIVTSWE